MGDLAKYILEGAGHEMETHYFPDYIACVDAIHDLIADGDTILVKASHGIHLENVVEVL